MMSIDQGKPVILVLLDLSVAFDTVEHNVPFSRLKDMFGLSGKVRYQRVSVHGILSVIQFLLSGVPQGSVLGPLVCTMHTHPLGIIAQRYWVKYHLYTGDTQLYISLDPESLNNLENCIPDIRLWMTQNLLKLNDNKTNIIYLTSPHCIKSLKTPALHNHIIP